MKIDYFNLLIGIQSHQFNTHRQGSFDYLFIDLLWSYVCKQMLCDQDLSKMQSVWNVYTEGDYIILYMCAYDR